MITDSFPSSIAGTWGFAFLAIHTLLVARTFRYCYIHRREGQVVFAWMLFFLIDFPAVPLASWLLRGNRWMNRLSRWGYQRFGSGPNVCWAALTALVGGGQWYFLGRYAGTLFRHLPGLE